MFGIGPMELIIVAIMFAGFALVPLAAIVVIIRLANSRGASGPRNCPHCGADLRVAGKQHGQPT
jgi:hypothetical protein